MNKRRLSSLRRALTRPLGAHVDAATLASLVSAEAAGEDVDALFATALAHLERCERCATDYDELAQMMSGALADMSAAAAAMPPGEVYSALLAQQLAREGLPAPRARSLAQQVAAGLPLVLHAAPRREQVDEALLQAALSQSLQPDESQTLVPTLVGAVQETLSALGLYLQGKAAAIWGREVSVRSHGYAATGWNRLQVALLPLLREPALGVEGDDNREWLLFSQRVGRPLPLNVRVHAERLGALSCRLLVHADRPGQPDASGRAVRLTFASKTITAETDAHGLARFEPLPIAAFAALSIEVAGD